MGDRYYVLHDPEKRWWNYPYAAYRGADYPFGSLIHIAATLRGALRIVRREKRRRQQMATAGLTVRRRVYLEEARHD